MGNERSRCLAGFVAVVRATVAIVTFGAVIESAVANPIGTAVYDELNNEPSLICPSLTEHAARQPLSGRFDCKQAPPPRETEPYEVRRAADDGKPTSSGEWGVFGRRRPPPAQHRWP